MTAAELRAQMRAKRRSLEKEEQMHAARTVCAHLLSASAYQHARCVMAYVAARGEVALDAVLADVLASGRILALPRCEGPGLMTARSVSDLTQLVPGAYGLMEPSPECPVVLPEEIDLILVPGIAFDHAGCRIGQGGGYYDRFLPGTRALRVGVCHDFARIAQVPAAPWDCRMDVIAMPCGMVNCEEYGGRT